MKTFKRLVFGLCFCALLVGTAYATGGDNPFVQATEKITSGTTHLKTISRILLALVIVITGIITMFGYFKMQLAFKVIIGAIIVASATEIANFFLQG